jgi:hypothetical protein
LRLDCHVILLLVLSCFQETQKATIIPTIANVTEIPSTQRTTPVVCPWRASVAVFTMGGLSFESVRPLDAIIAIHHRSRLTTFVSQGLCRANLSAAGCNRVTGWRPVSQSSTVRVPADLLIKFSGILFKLRRCRIAVEDNGEAAAARGPARRGFPANFRSLP